MAAVLGAFFGRERWDLTLQCAQFDIWPEEDIFHDPLHTDGGVHKSAEELLRPYLNTHNHAMVVLDQQFGGEATSRRSAPGHPCPLEPERVERSL